MSQRRTLRSAARQPRQPSHSNSPRPASLAKEVIVVSSDDEDLPVPKKRARRTTTQTTASHTVAHTPATIPEEFIEISSDDDIPLKTTLNPIAALEIENKALKEELAHLRRQQKQAAPLSVSPELQMTEAHKKLLHALDDPTSCKICTMRMWSPYLLGCGHAFCQKCLQDWFDVALNKHKADNPTYEQDTRALAQYHEVLRTPRLAAHERRYVDEQVRKARGNIPQPIYTCPTCRNTVKDKPAEDYDLKAVVRAFAETTGESSPKKALPPKGLKEAGPWDQFFPIQ